MSLTTLTVGDYDYRSYATVDEADEYLGIDPVLGTAWADAAERTKHANLAAATRHIDAHAWAGKKASSAQATEWPRADLTHPDGTAVDSATVPDEVEWATALLAATLVQEPTAFRDRDQAVVTDTTGPRSVTSYHRRRSDAQRNFGNTQAYRLVRRWLAGAAPTPAKAYGTDGVSEFADRDRFGRSLGIG